MISLQQAWAKTMGVPSIRIAVLDSGRTGHPELASQWSAISYDAANQDGDADAPPGQYNHGVAVAGLISNPNDATSIGVCPGCQLLNVNVVPPGSSSPNPYAIARGIRWAVDNGARVINMSLEYRAGKRCTDPEVEFFLSALQYAKERGVLIVAAAGNEGTNFLEHTLPAGCSDQVLPKLELTNIIAVAALDRSGTRLADYSNRERVTLAAPGGTATLPNGENWNGYGAGIGCNCTAPSCVDKFGDSTSGVLSTWTTTHGVHCYRYLAGTSLAAPLVAGVAGLMLSVNPSLTPEQVRSILRGSATPISGCNCGAGMLNAAEAVNDSVSDRTDTISPVARFTAQCTGLRCTLNAAASSDDRGIVSYDWRLPGEQLRRGSSVQVFLPGYDGHQVRLRVTDVGGNSHEAVGFVNPSQFWGAPRRGSYENLARKGSTLDFFHNDSGGWYLAWFTFRPDGTPTWYVSDIAPLSGVTWSARLFRTSWNGGAYQMIDVGYVRMDFSSPTEAWFGWQLDGRSGGEQVTHRTGGGGVSGAWFYPSEPGWGVSLNELSDRTEAVVTYYGANGPEWVRASSSVGLPGLNAPQRFIGQGLCPSCGGNGSPAHSPHGVLSINIPSPSALTGTLTFEIVMIWPRRQDVPISRITSP